MSLLDCLVSYARRFIRLGVICVWLYGMRQDHIWEMPEFRPSQSEDLAVDNTTRYSFPG